MLYSNLRDAHNSNKIIALLKYFYQNSNYIRKFYLALSDFVFIMATYFLVPDSYPL